MHLRPEEALDLIEMRAPEEQVHFWNQHIATCSSCLDQLQEWRRIRALLKRENLESAPDAVTAMAHTVFEPPGLAGLFAKSSRRLSLTVSPSRRWPAPAERLRHDSFFCLRKRLMFTFASGRSGPSDGSQVSFCRAIRARMFEAHGCTWSRREEDGDGRSRQVWRVRI